MAKYLLGAHSRTNMNGGEKQQKKSEFYNEFHWIAIYELAIE